MAKKRLARIVLAERNLTTPSLEGEVGFVFSGDDQIAAAREVHAFAKAHKEALVLGGVFAVSEREWRIVDTEMVMRLAQIPAREVLVAQIVGLLRYPLQKLVGVLSGPQRGLVITLSEMARKGI